MADKFLHAPGFESAPALPGELLSRLHCASNVSMTSGKLRLTYFNCRQSKTVTIAAVDSGTTAAGATPTLVRIGIYEEAGGGALTLVGSTANDTLLLAAANASYSKALSASVDLVEGKRYAFGLLVVTSQTAPTVAGVAINQASANRTPRACAQLDSQIDLPSSISKASLDSSLTNGVIYGVLT